MEHHDFVRLQVNFSLYMNNIILNYSTHGSVSDEHLESVGQLMDWLAKEQLHEYFMVWLIGAYAAVSTIGLSIEDIQKMVAQSDMDNMQMLADLDGPAQT